MSEATEAIAASRPKLLDGLLTPEQLEVETGWRWRTILRREAEGLPFIKIGATKLYSIEQVRVWILSHARGPAVPRGRGRPRKVA